MNPLKRFLLTLVAFALFVPTACTSNAAETQDQQLEKFLNANKASVQEREGYKFALQHPEILEVLPCYCGCKKLGHKSNHHCFMQGDPKLAKKNPFDPHGFVCPMCLQIALYAKQRHAKGASVIQIRDEIDKAFSKHAHLHPTDTPKPVKK